MGTLPLALPYDRFGLSASRQAVVKVWAAPCKQAGKDSIGGVVTAAGFVCFLTPARTCPSPKPQAPPSTRRVNYIHLSTVQNLILWIKHVFWFDCSQEKQAIAPDSPG